MVQTYFLWARFEIFLFYFFKQNLALYHLSFFQPSTSYLSPYSEHPCTLFDAKFLAKNLRRGRVGQGKVFELNRVTPCLILCLTTWST
jgi:hypothetical protein